MMNTRWSILFSLFLAASVLGCSEEKADEPPPVAKPEKKKSNIVKITTAVPYGKHVACEKIFEPTEFATLTSLDIGSMKDRSQSNSSMTSVCAFFRAGEPPKDDKQLKTYNKSNRKLGTLPGDEYCTVSLNCSIATSTEILKKQCEDRREKAQGMTAHEDSMDLGQYSCVRKTDRPPSNWAFTYQTVDTDTKCLVEVMGGPSIVDEELVQSCAKAGLDQLTKAKLTEFH